MSINVDPGSVTGLDNSSLSTSLSTQAHPIAPANPSLPEVAALVSELFAEGSLSWDQLTAIGRVPELERMLEATIAGVPLSRRVRS